METALRALVIALALTGAVASTQTSSSSAHSVASTSMRSSSMPVPTCPPDGKTDCGQKAAGQ